jgi:hypothetical protein
LLSPYGPLQKWFQDAKPFFIFITIVKITGDDFKSFDLGHGDGDHVPKTARMIPHNAFLLTTEWGGRTVRVFIWRYQPKSRGVQFSSPLLLLLRSTFIAVEP